ncbi:hypothetical protein VC83_02684 [Pseudogymnoascus destructans]|uniref:Uncharacterized protein n=2 Tax=Pseudogymnoascus destructans TaxID=655981 RepID=L8FR20_PSED2|nr:uncharacterized protein VC83_02684 [Pseudogymnoascus destructans]ELR02923.1 hypothetical protein GMDG_01144 [Pseudogymnoascus destructans 20631-21]OAF61179.1 hypothetical protein VC83_02684 [Pseudogymnoascus destructans]
MHYIRFLKPPQITRDAKVPDHHILYAKITVVNDLGESFLWCDIPIEATIRDSNGVTVATQSLVWKCEKRQLEVRLAMSEKKARKEKYQPPYQLSVWPSTGDFTPYNLAEVLSINRGQTNRPADGAVLRGLSAIFKATAESIRPVIYRHFKLNGGVTMSIDEDTGESIARHIWDAGVILSALLEELSQASNSPPAGLRLLGDLIKTVPSPSVLELGTGCGIVAITFALSVPASRVIATDLEEAAEVASDNLEQATNASYLNLDWSEPLPLRVAHENFDLILVADCTYNPDVVPYLVLTIAKLIEKSPSVLICLAMKVRHASEAVFFDLMKEHRIVQVGKHSERVGNLGDEDESVDIYLFKGAEAAKVLERASGLA